jgi:5-formaminoimidazole-4-carboxamide-1-(beta)-D-ribofuranosyl 5'-monophosphate synthetase
VISIEKYEDFMGLVPELEKRKIIIVPHGSFVAYLSLDEHKKMRFRTSATRPCWIGKRAANCSASG